MDLTALFSENKDEFSKLIKKEIKLNSNDAEKAVEISQKAIISSIANEMESNGSGTLLNLLSDDKNSNPTNSFLKGLGTDLIKALSSGGFGKEKASSIKSILLPFVIKIIAKKIGGNSGILESLLGGNSSKSNPIGSILKNVFK